MRTSQQQNSAATQQRLGFGATRAFRAAPVAHCSNGRSVAGQAGARRDEFWAGRHSGLSAPRRQGPYPDRRGGDLVSASVRCCIQAADHRAWCLR
ncbi:MAG: hypothetical protein ACRDHZ_19100 [Ktedonobacteraceae bacterium]